MFAKENYIHVKTLSNDLKDHDDIHPENTITYLPSRSSSLVGKLLTLKKKNPDAYENVLQGKLIINEARVKTPRKQVQPIEAVKSKFFNLSKSDRQAFLEWLEHEKENLD